MRWNVLNQFYKNVIEYLNDTPRRIWDNLIKHYFVQHSVDYPEELNISLVAFLIII